MQKLSWSSPMDAIPLLSPLGRALKFPPRSFVEWLVLVQLRPRVDGNVHAGPL